MVSILPAVFGGLSAPAICNSLPALFDCLNAFLDVLRGSMLLKDAPPDPRRWLESDFEADILVHFGMHGTVEWLPGSPLGNTGLSWSDVLMGNMPNAYIYACNNVSPRAVSITLATVADTPFAARLDVGQGGTKPTRAAFASSGGSFPKRVICSAEPIQFPLDAAVRIDRCQETRIRDNRVPQRAPLRPRGTLQAARRAQEPSPGVQRESCRVQRAQVRDGAQVVVKS